MVKMAQEGRSGPHVSVRLGTKALKEINKLFQAIENVFEDSQRAERFLIMPHPMLRMRAPIEHAIDHDDGINEVINILAQLAHGTGA